MSKKSGYKILVSVFFVIFVVFVMVFSIGLGMDNLRPDFVKVGYDLLTALLSSLITTFLLGLLAQIVSNGIIKAKKNDNGLKRCGIEEVCVSNNINPQDSYLMLGGKRNKNQYPSELSFLFLVGDSFLRSYAKQLAEAISNGCNIRLLIVRPFINGEPNPFIQRHNKYAEKKNNTCLTKILFTEVLPTLKAIEEKAKSMNPVNVGKIEVRTYIDEFMSNQRFSLYYDKDNNRTIHCWLNYQSLCKDAIYDSLLLKGTLSEDVLQEKETNKNLMFEFYRSFNILWDEYEKSPKLDEQEWRDWLKRTNSDIDSY